MEKDLENDHDPDPEIEMSERSTSTIPDTFIRMTSSPLSWLDRNS